MTLNSSAREVVTIIICVIAAALLVAYWEAGITVTLNGKRTNKPAKAWLFTK